MTRLIALQDFSPDGSRKIKAGETFTMTDKSAKFLVALKKAKYATTEQEKKRYRRRDMRAQD